MDLRIDDELNVATIKLTGVLSKEAILAAFDRAVADERYKEGMGRIWDFQNADLSTLDSTTIREMAQYSMRFPPGVNDVRVAFVTSRSLEFGLSRMFELASKAKTPIRVFRTMDEAEHWTANP